MLYLFLPPHTHYPFVLSDNESDIFVSIFCINQPFFTLLSKSLANSNIFQQQKHNSFTFASYSFSGAYSGQEQVQTTS